VRVCLTSLIQFQLIKFTCSSSSNIVTYTRVEERRSLGGRRVAKLRLFSRRWCNSASFLAQEGNSAFPRLIFPHSHTQSAGIWVGRSYPPLREKWLSYTLLLLPRVFLSFRHCITLVWLIPKCTANYTEL